MIATPEADVVLIVDDNPTNLEVLSELLFNAGVEIAVATSGEGALSKVEHEIPALVLLDVMMPGINGFETCQRLKQNPLTYNIPIIFMSALADPVDKVKGLSLGAVDYITKPFQHEEVLARVCTHLKLRNLTKTLEEQNHQLKQFTEDLEQRVADRAAELLRSLYKLEQAQLQLIQSEKMSALGNLVAGVAHEINNPVCFISGNLNEAKRTIQDLIAHLNLYRALAPETDIINHAQEIDLDYLIEDLPRMIDSMKLGCDRINSISTSLRSFSRADRDYPVIANLHEGIDSTILILKHRLKASESRPAIEIVTDYGNLPTIECFPGQLNQVFMNILANAIDALEESNIGRSFTDIQAKPNRIMVKTEMGNGEHAPTSHVVICIQDNGTGMTPDVKQKIFDRLYTTKAMGKGTGLGLAIARQIVVEKHCGAIAVNSTLGEGTEFVITLPVKANL